MKRVIVFTFAIMLSFSAAALEGDENDIEYLASVCASQMNDEPFSVKLAFCKMLVNRTRDTAFPSTLPAVVYEMKAKRGSVPPTSTDIHAAAAALSEIDFFEDILYMKKEKRKRCTTQGESGVHLYGWHFYS